MHRSWGRPGRWGWPLGLLALALTGCATARTIDSGYAETAAALRERFARNEWTKRSTIRSSVEEKAGRLSIACYEWEFPSIKVYCTIKATARSDGKTRVRIFVRDHNSWWAPFVHRPSWASGALDALAERLRRGRWGPMPWGGTAIGRNWRPAARPGQAPADGAAADPVLSPAR